MYVAMLQQKQSELRALEFLKSAEKDSNKFLPIIIINDATVESLKEIKKKYSEKVILDISRLEAESIEDLEEIIQMPDYSNFEILYPISVLVEGRSDLEPQYVKIDRNVITPFFKQWLLANLNLLPDFIIFDFKKIDGSVDNVLEGNVINIIKQLKNKSICVLSGAIPETVPAKADENYIQNRFEVELFQRISTSGGNNNKYIYGDYTTVSPNPSQGFVAIVQIKYTLKNKYKYFRNGIRRGSYDFVKVCNEIITSIPDFDPLICWGDEFIKQISDSSTNKGNPSTWASIGINKHISVCILENL